MLGRMAEGTSVGWFGIVTVSLHCQLGLESPRRPSSGHVGEGISRDIAQEGRPTLNLDTTILWAMFLA